MKNQTIRFRRFLLQSVHQPRHVFRRHLCRHLKYVQHSSFYLSRPSHPSPASIENVGEQVSTAARISVAFTLVSASATFFVASTVFTSSFSPQPATLVTSRRSWRCASSSWTAVGPALASMRLMPAATDWTPVTMKGKTAAVLATCCPVRE